MSADPLLFLTAFAHSLNRCEAGYVLQFGSCSGSRASLLDSSSQCFSECQSPSPLHVIGLIALLWMFVLFLHFTSSGRSSAPLGTRVPASKFVL